MRVLEAGTTLVRWHPIPPAVQSAKTALGTPQCLIYEKHIFRDDEKHLLVKACGPKPVQPSTGFCIAIELGEGHFSGSEQPEQMGVADMLEVGLPGSQQLSLKEQQAHFALWALVKSPLIIGADLRLAANCLQTVHCTPSNHTP